MQVERIDILQVIEDCLKWTCLEGLPPMRLESNF